MPHLQELQENFQSKGFTVIGSHCQIPSPRVKQFLEEKKITFPIYQSLSIPEAPARADCRRQPEEEPLLPGRSGNSRKITFPSSSHFLPADV